MATLDKITTNNYSRNVKNSVPILAEAYNKAVDQINENTTAVGVAQAAVDVLEANNRTTGGTTATGDTTKILVSLTSANLLAMNGAPVSVIPAAGAGTTIDVKSCVAIFDSTVTAYANGGVIYLSYGNTTPITNNVAATFLTGGDKIYKLNPVNAAGGINMLANTAVTITNDTAAFITGTGVARLLIEYAVITTGL